MDSLSCKSGHQSTTKPQRLAEPQRLDDIANNLIVCFQAHKELVFILCFVLALFSELVLRLSSIKYAVIPLKFGIRVQHTTSSINFQIYNRNESSAFTNFTETRNNPHRPSSITMTIITIYSMEGRKCTNPNHSHFEQVGSDTPRPRTTIEIRTGSDARGGEGSRHVSDPSGGHGIRDYSLVRSRSSSHSQNPDGTHRRIAEIPDGLSRRASQGHRLPALMPPPAVYEPSHHSHQLPIHSRPREHTRASAAGGRTVREHRPATMLPPLEEHPSRHASSSHHGADPSRLVSVPTGSRMANRRVSELRGTGPGGSSMVVGGNGPTSHPSHHASHHSGSHHSHHSHHSGSHHSGSHHSDSYHPSSHHSSSHH